MIHVNWLISLDSNLKYLLCACILSECFCKCVCVWVCVCVCVCLLAWTVEICCMCYCKCMCVFSAWEEKDYRVTELSFLICQTWAHSRCVWMMFLFRPPVKLANPLLVEMALLNVFFSGQNIHFFSSDLMSTHSVFYWTIKKSLMTENIFSQIQFKAKLFLKPCKQWAASSFLSKLG